MMPEQGYTEAEKHTHPDYTDPYTMKDWTRQLRRNAACCELAAAIFKARAEVYGGNPDLTTAPAHVRDRFIAHAADVVDAMKPEPEPAHVAPFAAVRTPDSLFNFAASLARQSFPDATAPHLVPALVRSANQKDGE